MDRGSFLKVAASSLLALSTNGIAAKTLQSKSEAEAEGSSEQGLKVRFLGTGAADWNGRDERGELRRLSSVLLDERLIIDLTASSVDMIPQYAHPDTIFYTHSHGDHYHPATALKLGIKDVYVSQTWYDIAVADFKRAAKELSLPMPQIHALYIGQPIKIGDIAVTPLPANHVTGYINEQPLIYLIEKAGVRLLYATDTAGITAAAAKLSGLDVHNAGKPVTAIIMEATMGLDYDLDSRRFTHSSVGDIERMVKMVETTKRYAPPAGQPVYLTHMARKLHGTQAELDANLPKPLRAAHDGLEVVFRAK